MGAGDVTVLGPELLAELERRSGDTAGSVTGCKRADAVAERKRADSVARVPGQR
jgi:hypothetical protein